MWRFGCHQLTDPPLPDNAVSFSPPSVYGRWWEMAEACSGIDGSLSSVAWYSIPNATGVIVNGESFAGYWAPASNRIVLRQDALLDGTVVRHEMLHALLRERTHSRRQFLDRCAGVVQCSLECVSTAEQAPPDTAGLTVSPDSLDVSVEVETWPARSANEQGIISISVLAHNRLDRAVLVDPVAGMPPGWTAAGFGFMLTGVSGGIAARWPRVDASSLRFRAGETKRAMFDLVVGDDLAEQRPPPGDYRVRGLYGQRLSSEIAIVIATTRD